MTRYPSRRSRCAAPKLEAVTAQDPFPLDCLADVRRAAARAGNPFFARAKIDETYARRVFCGRGLLFLAQRCVPCPGWRAYFAFFTPVTGGAWLVLLPHPTLHPTAGEARSCAEELAARMHLGSWPDVLDVFAGRTAC